MIKKFLPLLFIAFYLNSYAQEENVESYYPLTKGISKTLTWYHGKYREIIGDTINLEGKTYTEIRQVFPPDTEIAIYVRRSNDTVYFFNEKSRKEKVFFGVSPNKGQQIGDGTVIKTNANLRTPAGKLTDLLVVKMEYSNELSDTRYYKRGLGLVAVKNNNKLICYYIPD